MFSRMLTHQYNCNKSTMWVRTIFQVSELVAIDFEVNKKMGNQGHRDVISSDFTSRRKRGRWVRKGQIYFLHSFLLTIQSVYVCRVAWGHHLDCSLFLLPDASWSTGIHSIQRCVIYISQVPTCPEHPPTAILLLYGFRRSSPNAGCCLQHSQIERKQVL